MSSHSGSSSDTSLQARRAALRRELRAKRQALDALQQQQAAEQACERLLALEPLQSATHIALYLANDGELDPHPSIRALWSLDIHVYLPVIDEQQHLRFAPYTANSTMASNRYGIPEPQCDAAHLITIAELDVLVVPLVGFDAQGQRIGMGGGFYDRALADWYQGKFPALHPLGFAHDCQRVDSIPTEPWDIPLPRILTPSKLWQFSAPAV